MLWGGTEGVAEAAKNAASSRAASAASGRESLARNGGRGGEALGVAEPPRPKTQH